MVQLIDQGDARTLDPSQFRFGGRDQSWNTQADNFRRANEATLDQLAVRIELETRIDEIALRLRPGGSIGAVPIRAPHTQKVAGGVLVQPRFGWNGIGFLLQEMGWIASPNILELPMVPGSAREIPPWVLAGPVVARFAAALQRLKQGFSVREEVLQQPRGQILWDRYATEQMARGTPHLLPCRFPHLGPDTTLRSWIRWGLEHLRRSMVPSRGVDVLASRLIDQIDSLLISLVDVFSQVPSRHELQQLSRRLRLSSDAIVRATDALGWLVDERGLAGKAETDGLSWSMVMSQLFEVWVEQLVRRWSRDHGGVVRAARSGETLFPIQWQRALGASMGSLVPDLVIDIGDRKIVVDAKYKRHLEELDDRRWAELSEELRTEHRHDLHQVLAYASLYDSAEMTAILAYPMNLNTWQRLAQTGQTVNFARLTTEGRQLSLGLLGVPLQLAPGQSITSITEQWGQLAVLDG